MKELKIPMSDLCSFAVPMLAEIQRQANAHCFDAGGRFGRRSSGCCGKPQKGHMGVEGGYVRDILELPAGSETAARG